MFTVAFWRDAAERATRAAAWTLLGTLGGTAAAPHVPVSWAATGIATGLAALLSLLASIVATTGASGRVGSPSFLRGQPPAPAEPAGISTGRHAAPD